MHAYLYLGKAQEFAETKGIKKINIREFDIKKITDVRDLIKETNFAFKEKAIYILRDFDKASVVAQNGFLKRLEEPQENLTFILTASQESAVLPTIISRCLVKNLGFKAENLTAENLWNKNINERFSLISNMKAREEAIEMLENMLNSKSKNIKTVKYVINTLERIKANANTQLQLSNLVVKME